MNLRIAGIAGIVLGTLFSAGVGAESTHYIVFAGEPGQPAQPVFYARVERAADAAPEPSDDAAELELPTAARRRGRCRAPRRTSAAARRVRARSRARRPAPRNAAAAGDDREQFLLRLPVAAADAIELDDGRVFDLEALARDAARLPLAGIGGAGRTATRRTPAHPPTASTFWCWRWLHRSANRDLRHPCAEPLRRDVQCQSLRGLRQPGELTAGFVTSNQSGADHPPYQAGCGTLACCADSAASTDPFAGQFSDTALDARFCTSNIHRLLTTSSSKTMAAAAAYANWDHILVTVNDSVYGGAGGSYAVTSANASGPLVVIHEYGHSFTKLADEYTSAYPGFPACSDITSPPCEANVTNQTTPALISGRRC
ncbi:MAG: hypothetical protein IPH76_17490 [Xanthomonadales bacterium]|nr:hypothetical protein [Xanthomonadales bacterium]